jgi:hypothetical protein
MSEQGWPTYRFKWSNVDLGEMTSRRRFAADKLRREADILLRRADQIMEEAYEWERALEPLPPPPEAGDG